MRKIILMLFFGCFGLLFADGMEMQGLIANIDNDNKTITINNTPIQILPQTKIKLDDCGIFGTDIYGKFVDLTLNSFAEVELFPNTAFAAGQTAAPAYIAKEVEIKCSSNRAY